MSCLLSTTLLGACLDDEAAPALAEDDAEIAASTSEFTHEPTCPDQHATIPGRTMQCIVPDEGFGIRMCTDHVTFHYRYAFELLEPRCVLSSTTVRTTCGPCFKPEIVDPPVIFP